MSIHKLHLRKLLQLFYLPYGGLTTQLRGNIRNEIAKKQGIETNGGDFHTPFWSDAKNHVAGRCDLPERTRQRISDNPRRKRLYPQLTDGFLGWWNDKRRWSNEDCEFAPENVKGQHEVIGLNAVVKVENLMALEVGDKTNKLIYPYFSEHPSLCKEAARIGLWLMDETFNKYSAEDIRILDVLRGHSFSVSECPLRGDEKALFKRHYERILKGWKKLREDYES